jgi:NADH dehydrogenase
MPTPFTIVTGALGYTGRYITSLLLGRGVKVRTLTGHPGRPNPFGDAVEVVPFNFDDPDTLAHNFEGAQAVFNTYWIRFPSGELTFDSATRNVLNMIDAARRAAVGRFVQISITNANAASPLPYFRGKGLIERYLIESGLSYTILRPAIVFGSEDILLNNIAWMLRRFPVFTIPGSGTYRVQPVFVGDLAQLATETAFEQGNLTIDAVGPELFRFSELVALIARTVNSNARIVHVAPTIQLILAQLFGKLTGDATLTRDEIRGLMLDLLVSKGQPTAPTRLSEWLGEHSNTLGIHYRSEMSLRS